MTSNLSQIKHAKPKYKDFLKIILLQIFKSFNSSDKQSFPPKINQLNENSYLYETDFNFFETSLNIQNDSAHSTNFKIFNCL